MNQRTTTLGAVSNGEKPANPVVEFNRYMDKLKPQMALALPKHLNADRMSRLVLTAFSSTPALQACTFQSIAGAIMTAAAQGLEPGVNGQGYLIPYNGICTWVPGWKGLVDLVSRTGRASVWTGVVYKNDGDQFDYELGDSPYVKHKPSEEPYPDGAKWTHVYAVGRVRDAVMPVIEVWSRAKVERHLKQFNKVGARHYAKANENNFEMYGRKVALLQVLKYMPSSVELQAALDSENAANDGKGVVLNGDDLVSVMPSDTPDPDTGEVAAPAPAPAAEQTTPATAGASYAVLADRIEKAADADVAGLVLDEGRGLPPEQYQDLVKVYERRFAAK